MNIQELTQGLAFLQDQTTLYGIKLYFVIDENGQNVVRFADIAPEVATDLKAQFTQYLQNKIINNDELAFAEITEADDSSNTIYHYNLQDRPPLLDKLYEVADREIFADPQQEYPNFSFSSDDLNKIKGFIICLGNELNKIVMYKKHYPISLMKRGSYYGLIPSATRLERFTDNIIKINNTVEFLIVGGELVVLSVKTFQNSFGFDQIIRDKAEENLDLISSINMLENIEGLRELAADLKYAKKLMKIKASSPVLLIPFETVRAFIQQHPKLRRRIRFNGDLSRIDLHTRSSKVLFIKILNDDFLKSELTQLLYDSQKKAALDGSEEPDETDEP